MKKDESNKAKSGGSYPMRVVSRLTGLTPDVIRAWERRYGAITPDRTAGNARRYSSHEIRRLELLREAVSRGHQIGEIGSLGDAELRELSQDVLERHQESPIAALRDGYLECIERWDVAGAEAHLARAASLHGPRAIVLEVVAPILREVGQRWAQGGMSVAQEHAVSAQVRGLLATLLRTTPSDPGAMRIVCAAPEGHEHELGAMLGAVLAAQRGLAPVYLGPNVPLSDLEAAMASSGARVALLSVARDVPSRELKKLSEGLRAIAQRVDLWLGLPSGHPLANVEGLRVFHSFEDLDVALAHRAGGVVPVA